MAMTRLSNFERTVMPHLDAAYNLARWLTRNDHDAEDVVQEACLRAFRFFDGLKAGSPRAWLLAIVRNTGYTWLQKNRPAEVVAIDDAGTLPDEDEGASPEVVLLQGANRRLVNEALEALPVGFREVLVMRELEDLSYKEIAEIAAIPLGTVMSRLSRGREMLRHAIEMRLKKAS
jgi:RNA polymerase sigma-70 factor (ECF subfamily)